MTNSEIFSRLEELIGAELTNDIKAGRRTMLECARLIDHNSAITTEAKIEAVDLFEIIFLTNKVVKK
jgi:hypothetical protein